MVERYLGKPLVSPRAIYEELDKYVIGQDEAKRAMAVAAYHHQRRVEAGPETLLRKSNVLLIGPTGSGKTHLARQLARILELPMAIVNATEYTEAGYYGKDVEVMIAELLYKTEGDLQATERGIVFIDEIDKISRRNHFGNTGAGQRDIGGEGVQQGILKLLEANKIFVPLNVTQHWSKHDFVAVDVTNILFICAGTFTDLGRGRRKAEVGFLEKGQAKPARRVETRDLEEYGMLAELLGRLPVVIELSELTEEELGRILVDPPDAIWREYRELFALDEIKLELEDSGRQAIVSEARRRKLGARGLRTIVEAVLAEWSFEAPERTGQTLIVDAQTVARSLH